MNQMYPFLSLFVIQLIVIVIEKINEIQFLKSVCSCVSFLLLLFPLHFLFYNM